MMGCKKRPPTFRFPNLLLSLGVVANVVKFLRADNVGWTEFKCPDGHLLSQLESMFREWNAEKRLYNFGCSRLGKLNTYSETTCAWTPAADSAHGDIFLSCPRSRYVAGVSIMKQGSGNQWKLRCCEASNLKIREKECYQTPLLNAWMGALKYAIPTMTVSRKWQSLYDDSKRDRKWWLEVCPFNFVSHESLDATSTPSALKPDASTKNPARNLETLQTATPPDENFYTFAKTTQEPDLAESLRAYQQRELQFQRMLSQIASQPSDAPVIPPDLLKAAYGWYPLNAPNKPDHDFDLQHSNPPTNEYYKLVKESQETPSILRVAPGSGSPFRFDFQPIQQPFFPSLGVERRSQSLRPHDSAFKVRNNLIPTNQIIHSNLQYLQENYGRNPTHTQANYNNLPTQRLHGRELKAFGPSVYHENHFPETRFGVDIGDNKDAFTIPSKTKNHPSKFANSHILSNLGDLPLPGKTSVDDGTDDDDDLEKFRSSSNVGDTDPHQVFANYAGGGSGLPPRPKVSHAFSLDKIDELSKSGDKTQLKSQQLPLKPKQVPSETTNSGTPLQSTNKKGENIIDIIGGASDFLSNMHKGMKFAFSDDEGNFSFRDGLSTTLDFFGLCGNANRRL